MPGLVPGIHVFLAMVKQDVDGRDKPGHDMKCESFVIAAGFNLRGVTRCVGAEVVEIAS